MSDIKAIFIIINYLILLITVPLLVAFLLYSRIGELSVFICLVLMINGIILLGVIIKKMEKLDKEAESKKKNKQ